MFNIRLRNNFCLDLTLKNLLVFNKFKFLNKGLSVISADFLYTYCQYRLGLTVMWTYPICTISGVYVRLRYPEMFESFNISVCS